MVGNRIRVGIIGANINYGWGTRAHLPGLQQLPELELAAVCTTRRETAEETARRFEIPLAFDDHRELVSHPDIDLVLVCVRVPGHHELVTATLHAGKHVFCEWPLGASLDEAVQMRDLAESTGVRNMVGLQARGAPALNYVRELVADGYVGEVLAATMHSSLPGAGQRPSRSAWAFDRTQGASTLTIAGGHSLEALCFCLGEFSEVSAVVSTQVTTATVTDTGETLDVSSPDNVLVSGRLESGAVASVHIKSVPQHGTGFTLEVNGSEGTLVVSSDGSAQIGELALRGARGHDAPLEELPVPERNRWVPESVPDGPALNVAQLFRRLGERISDGAPAEPDFNTAVARHRLLSAIERASESGERQTV